MKPAREWSSKKAFTGLARAIPARLTSASARAAFSRPRSRSRHESEPALLQALRRDRRRCFGVTAAVPAVAERRKLTSILRELSAGPHRAVQRQRLRHAALREHVFDPSPLR